MRNFLAILIAVVVVSGCSLTGDSGFGSRLVPAACVAQAAPWILGDELPTSRFSSLDNVPRLRAVTYNLHSGLGPRRAFSKPREEVERYLGGIADAIAQFPKPIDVVGLNEVDFAARRSGNFDEALFLAQKIEARTREHYQVLYGETWRRRMPGFEVRFGNAVLVRHPVTKAVACLYDDTTGCNIPAADADMPALRSGGFLNRMTREARGLIKLTMDFNGRPVDVIVTHLDAFVLPEREAQAAHVLRRFVDPRHTTLVLGDFNSVPTLMTYTRAFFAADRTHDILTSGGLADARVLYDSRRGQSDFRVWATYPAEAPVWPLDTVLGSLDLVPRDVKVIATQYSDHYGFYVEYGVVDRADIIAEQRARHDAIRQRQLAQIMRCDLTQASAAQLHWLKAGTEYLDIASAAQRKALVPVTMPF